MVWAYERGTLQYDIICALILLFIFLVPKSCLVNGRTGHPTVQSPGVVQHDEIAGARAGSRTISKNP
jgi:hypothetical protein